LSASVFFLDLRIAVASQGSIWNLGANSFLDNLAFSLLAHESKSAIGGLASRQEVSIVIFCASTTEAANDPSHQ
jgi:hypothetical protein